MRQQKDKIHALLEWKTIQGAAATGQGSVLVAHALYEGEFVHGHQILQEYPVDVDAEHFVSLYEEL